MAVGYLGCWCSACFGFVVSIEFEFVVCGFYAIAFDIGWVALFDDDRSCCGWDCGILVCWFACEFLGWF